MLLPVVAFNTFLFAGLGLYAALNAKRSTSKSLKLMWVLTSLPALAVVVGGLQRLALQAVRIGWIPEDNFEVLLLGWQVVQSILVAAIGITVLLGMRRVGRRLTNMESIAGALLDRVAAVDVKSLELTPRERNVLDVLGSSHVVDNETLAEQLGISTHTAHTHVNALLRKTKLHDRRDLAVVAYVYRGRSQQGSHPTG